MVGGRRGRPATRCAPGRGLRLPVAVDDSAAVQVVRRDLDLDPVTRLDPDAVAPHLARGVADRRESVLERNLVHAVAEGLGDLALELDFLLLRRHAASFFETSPPARHTAAAGGDKTPSSP